jgi:hypothetical protein
MNKLQRDDAKSPQAGVSASMRRVRLFRGVRRQVQAEYDAIGVENRYLL